MQTFGGISKVGKVKGAEKPLPFPKDITHLTDTRLAYPGDSEKLILQQKAYIYNVAPLGFLYNVVVVNQLGGNYCFNILVNS